MIRGWFPLFAGGRGVPAGIALLLAVGLAGCSYTPRGGTTPDYHVVTATARYRPVDTPGTQRRVAQNDAEEIARRDLLNFVGNMKLDARQTVNDLTARDPRLRSELLNMVRTAEVFNWTVDQQCGAVQVWLRLDLNRVRALVAGCA
jgi:hypothetical protein